jgi:iron complex transport system ATP-binding protein
MSAASTDATLVVSNLSAGYRRRPVLKGLTLDPIQAGHITALVGPNGAGKSTLLRVLAGLLPGSGSIRFNGEDWLGGHRFARGAPVGFMPQFLPQRHGLNVLESVLSALKASPLGEASPWSNKAVRDRAMSVLERIGIVELALEPLGHLSGGQRQLVSLAQSIARTPAVLLLDEPTSALDLSHQVRVMKLVGELAHEGRVVIAVVHDLSLAARWAGAVVVLHRGRVAASGTPAEALTPAVISEVYGVDARVERCSLGTLQVLVDG